MIRCYVSSRCIVKLRGLVQHETCSPRNTLSWPHDHKLRKFLSLNQILKISNSTELTVLINCRCAQNVLLNKSSNFRFINKTTAKGILVWHFDFRIFSVYGHRAWIAGYVSGSTHYLKSACFTRFVRHFFFVNAFSRLCTSEYGPVAISPF